MSFVRALEAGDVRAVATMFQSVLRKHRSPPTIALVDYMRKLYLDASGQDDGIRSLVHVDDAGRISGFVGVRALPMTLDGRPLRAAICSSLMVDGRERDPMAGARLLKAYIDGPQDLSFSETANEVSVQLWTRLRGAVLPQYSLDWVRVIRPAGFVASQAKERASAAGLLKPAAAAIDGLVRLRLKPGDKRWSAVASHEMPQATRVATIDRAGFAACCAPLSSHFALRPRWEQLPLDDMLADAGAKPELGELALAAVSSRSGALLGAFAYHAAPGRIGRVLQVLAHPGHAGPVVDALIDDAARRGLCGLRGRTQPALLEAMLPRRIAFVPVASTVVHSRDADIMRALKDQRAFLNGLAGESWGRLIGGQFG